MSGVCVSLPSAYIQAVRGLLIIGLALGLVANTLVFFGLECTNLGGDPRNKDDTLKKACAVHVLGCEWELYCFSKSSEVERVASQKRFWFFLFCFFHSRVSPALPHAGVSDMAAYCLYINRVVAAFLHSKVDPTKLR